MKIEKPRWDIIFAEANSYKETIEENLDRWFYKFVEPLNKMLGEAKEVTGFLDEGRFFCHPHPRPNRRNHTHKALLINIQEIKPKTKGERAIELLRDMFECENLEPYHWEQCEALLEESE